MYYYIGPNNQQQGPVPPEQLLSRGVTGETMVWKAGMAQWKKAKEVPELSRYFAGSPYNAGNPYDDQSTRFTTPPPNFGNNGNFGNYGPQYAGQFGGNQPTGPKPDSHLVWGILTTLFCCLPFGIVSIVYASKVDSTWSMGQQMEAEEYSRKAKNWAWASALSALAIWVIYIGLIVLGVTSGAFD